MKISLAKIDDLAAITQIYNESIAERNATADLVAKSVSERESWFYDHAKNPNRPIFVMRDDSDEIVAWSSFSNYKDRAAYNISSEISIYVDIKHRGKGFGAEFLEFMLQIAPSLNIKNIVATVFANNSKSLKMFKKFGFKEWGFLPQMCDMQDFIADIYILGKSL